MNMRYFIREPTPLHLWHQPSYQELLSAQKIIHVKTLMESLARGTNPIHVIHQDLFIENYCTTGDNSERIHKGLQPRFR